MTTFLGIPVDALAVFGLLVAMLTIAFFAWEQQKKPLRGGANHITRTHQAPGRVPAITAAGRNTVNAPRASARMVSRFFSTSSSF